MRQVKKILSFLPDKTYIYLYYFAKYKRFPNLKNPQTFNEKLQYLKLNDRKEMYSQIVDKVLVKSYVADIIGEEYIIPTIGVWDRAEDIDFDSLPEKFVLKTNHNSGDIVICKNKSTSDVEEMRRQIEKSLNEDFYSIGREWPYKSVKRKVLAEPYIIDYETGELRDYKFFCFNGEPKCFKIDFGRIKEHHANYYDMDGILLPFGEDAFPPLPEKQLEIPNSIKKMSNLAKKLSSGFPFLRVDFYWANNQIFFGELTLYPASGFGKFTSAEWEYKLGNWLKLPR